MVVSNPPPGADVWTFVELAGGEDKDVTSTGAWEDWDISAIIPAGAKAALISIHNATNAASYTAGVRNNGSALVRQHTIGQNYNARHFIEALVDTNRVLEIYGSHTTNCVFNVMGYWI